MSVTSFDQAWHELERYFHVVLPDALGNPALGFRDGTWFRLGLGGRPQPLMARSAILEYPDQAGSVVQICCWWMRENHAHPRALDLATELAITVAEMARGTARVRQPLPGREIVGRELGGASVFDGPVQVLGDPLTGPAVPAQRATGPVPALPAGHRADQGRPPAGGWTGGWPTRAPQNDHGGSPDSRAWAGRPGLPTAPAPGPAHPQPPHTSPYGHPADAQPVHQRPAYSPAPAAPPQAAGGYRRPAPEASGFWPVDQIPQAAPTQAIPAVDPRRTAAPGTGEYALPGRNGQAARRAGGTNGHHPSSRAGRPAAVGPVTDGYPWRDVSR